MEQASIRSSPASRRSICGPPIKSTRDLQIYGLINNVANYRGATYGTLYETDSTTNQVTGASVPNLFSSDDPRAITVAPPFEAFVGLKYTLNDAPPPRRHS